MSDWRLFFADAPGERFRRRYERLRGGGAARTLARIVAGVVVVAIGVILLFIPGPGVLTILAGLTLFAGHSYRLSAWLDRGEPAARSMWGRAVGRWRRVAMPLRVSVIALGVIAGTALTAVAATRWLG